MHQYSRWLCLLPYPRQLVLVGHRTLEVAVGTAVPPTMNWPREETEEGAKAEMVAAAVGKAATAVEVEVEGGGGGGGGAAELEALADELGLADELAREEPLAPDDDDGGGGGGEDFDDEDDAIDLSF